MKTILVVYHSQEKGNTRKMAELVAEDNGEDERTWFRQLGSPSF